MLAVSGATALAADSAQAHIRLALAPPRAITPQGALFLGQGAAPVQGELLVRCAAGERYRVDAPAHLRREGPAAIEDGAYDCDGVAQRHRFTAERLPAAGTRSVIVTFF